MERDSRDFDHDPAREGRDHGRFDSASYYKLLHV